MLLLCFIYTLSVALSYISKSELLAKYLSLFMLNKSYLGLKSVFLILIKKQSKINLLQEIEVRIYGLCFQHILRIIADYFFALF